jgi:DNA-damage-inducible protein J
MKTVNVTLRVDKELKEQADALFEDMGLSLNTACRMFLTRAVKEQRIPFEVVRKPDRKTLRALSDAEQGKDLSRDFDSVDELMDELKE